MKNIKEKFKKYHVPDNYDIPMDAATRASRYSAVLVERMWTMLEEEKTKVGGSCPLGV